MEDVFTAFQTQAEPREKAILVAIAVSPDADVTKISELTAIGTRAVRESLRWLTQHEYVFITTAGGYVIHTAVAF